MMGLGLANILKLQARAAEAGHVGGPGWGKAKHVILCYLQGGPSHLDLWDPKPEAPDNVRSIFKPIATKIPGINFTELMPKLAKVNDKMSLIRSMSYTPNGLFNHTAAIYQMMTGYTTDKVSPSGLSRPAQSFPNFGSNIIRLRPPTEPMLPFVMLPRPLQESNVVGKGGTAGFLGKSFDPYSLPGRRRHGHEQDGPHQDRRPQDAPRRVRALRRRARLRDAINDASPDIDKAVADFKLDDYYDRAQPRGLGRARNAFDLAQVRATRNLYGRNTFGKAACLHAASLRPAHA